MKKIFVSMFFILSVGLTTVLANDKPDMNGKIKESFKKEFVGAESVKWDEVEDYYIATFVFLRHRVIAYFTQDGELLGSARCILFNELPLSVSRSFSTRFAGYNFLELYEISNTEGTSYRLTVETQKKRYHVKMNTAGIILDIIKIKK